LAEGERRLAAIMFTDIVGYSALTQNNESLAMKLLERHRELIRPVLSRYNGLEIKTIGDAFLVEFGSALQGVECAFDIQKTLHEFSDSSSDQMNVRIGIHVGDVIHSRGDVYGDAVNIASRIEPLAKKGGICISGQVFDQVRNKVSYRMTKLEIAPLKNIALNIDVYKVDLPWEADTGGTATLRTDRIAVLPFVNISPDPNDEFFADGLTEELIANLSLVKGLKVIARTSVMNYKKKEKNVSEIGKELGVGTIVEGSVRKVANRIRVTVQLIDVNSEEHLWASNYDRSLDDVFAVQSDIASRVTESIPNSLVKTRPIKAQADTEDVRAYMYYLQGRQLVHSSVEEPLRQSLHLFEMALQLDRFFPRAYVGIAQAYASLGLWNFIGWDESCKKAKAAVEKALEMNPQLPEAHSLLAQLAYMEDNLEECAREARIAIEKNPNLADAYLNLGESIALSGDVKEWVTLLQTAYQLDPLSPQIIRRLGYALFFSGKIDEALDHWNRTLHLDPYTAYRGLTDYYISIGDYDQAEKAIRELEKIQPYGENTLLNIGYLAALRGDRKKADEIIQKLAENYPKGSAISGSIGLIYFALGDLDKFFELMYQSVENHTLPASNLLRSPLFVAARKDARFLGLFATIGIQKLPAEASRN
jgi:adenylate cyclase